MIKNVGFISLGCDKNRVDTEIMLSILSKRGYNIVNDEKKADLIIVNTCGFIEDAKLESIETIIEMSKQKENGRCKAVVATGCMAQRYSDELLKEIPEIDAVVGTGNYHEICDIVERISNGERGIIKTDNINYSLDFEDRILTTPEQYAYVKIAEGCNNNCTYCIIPKLRGKFRSRNMESIIEEVKGLGQKGVKEVILVAQDTTMYGIDIYRRKALSELLGELDKINTIEWIRIMYSYPEEIDDELIDTIAKSRSICHYFDIPLQHVSNKILKLMNRRNTYEDTVKLINKIREKIPDSKIRTTFIVGFPGEDEKDFELLCNFVKDYKLDRVGIFTYSQEEDTPAALMGGQLTENIKEFRKNKLMEIQSKISAEKNKELLNKEVKVLIEGKSNDGKYYGRTYADAPDIDQQVFVECKHNTLEAGDMVNAIIRKYYTYDLIGEVKNESGK